MVPKGVIIPGRGLNKQWSPTKKMIKITIKEKCHKLPWAIMNDFSYSELRDNLANSTYFNMLNV